MMAGEGGGGRGGRERDRDRKREGGRWEVLLLKCMLMGFLWHIWSDIDNCEGWLSPGAHSSGGRALTA